MSDTEKLILTDAAKKLLDEYKTLQGEILLREARLMSFVPGQDFTELTASDLLRTQRLLSYRGRTRRASKSLLANLMLAFGMSCALASFYWEQLKAMTSQQPDRFATMAIGVCLIFCGIFYKFLLSRFAEAERSREIQQRVLEQERLSESLRSSIESTSAIKDLSELGRTKN